MRGEGRERVTLSFPLLAISLPFPQTESLLTDYGAVRKAREDHFAHKRKTYVVSLSMKMCAQRKPRKRPRSSAVCTLPMVPCSSSPVAGLYLAKNEAPADEADLNVNATLL